MKKLRQMLSIQNEALIRISDAVAVLLMGPATDCTDCTSEGETKPVTVTERGKQWTITERGKQWTAFAAKVLDHVENYTVPQYGDAPNDNVESWTAEQCIAQISRYAARFGHNVRERQDLLDLLKIAHYAALAHFKLSASEANK